MKYCNEGIDDIDDAGQRFMCLNLRQPCKVMHDLWQAMRSEMTLLSANSHVCGVIR